MDTLRVWRARRLLTQQQLAEKARISVSTVASIEEGRYLPRLRTIQKICEVLLVEANVVTEFVTAIEEAGKKEVAAQV